jgi:hypothetical protein
MKNSKRCIAVLTRGYNETSQYDTLIKRNQSIEKRIDSLEKEEIDVLIFHEGNINDSDQEYIKIQTSSLKIIFINVNNGMAFKEDKKNIPFNDGCPWFGFGYRSMCSFWFVDFWHFVQEYDYLLRIDEDCFIDFDIWKVFQSLQTHSFVAGKWEMDDDSFTIGLNELTLEFIKSEVGIEKEFFPKNPCSGPYTNVFGINLKVRDNPLLKKYIHEVDESNKIYSQRWGDLPLWGEAIDYVLGKDELLIDSLSYYHESHHSYVN